MARPQEEKGSTCALMGKVFYGHGVGEEEGEEEDGGGDGARGG